MSGSVRPHRQQPNRLPCPWDSPGKNTGVGCHFLLQCMKVKVKSLSRVRPSATPWTAAYQAPPSMGFSRQEYWSGVPLPSPNWVSREIRFLFKKIWNTKKCEVMKKVLKHKHKILFESRKYRFRWDHRRNHGRAGIWEVWKISKTERQS